MRRAFSTGYLAAEPEARAFIAADFRAAGERAAAARRAAERTVSPGLLAALREQDARLPAPSPARQRHIDMLAAGGCAVVATGQQVGLFLGPLYSFYKAASAIAVARAIAREAGVPCVPLFWLQTEDHDFAEIAACAVGGIDGAPVRLALRADDVTAGDGRASIAHRTLGPEVAALVDALGDALPAGEAAAEVVALLRAHYQPGRSIAGAFAAVLATVFADEGLLILDPRDARVAADAAPLYQRILGGGAAIEGVLSAQRARLHAAGFDEQIAVREDCSLLFFHPRGVTGPRFRLQCPAGEPARWTLAGDAAVIDQSTLLATLAREPLRFSTSALLRPIVQDTLLPTVAYVGGPGEINYFAQLPPLYDHLAVPMPLIVPRGRFRCLDPRTRRLLRELDLSPDDAALPRAALADRLPVTCPAGAPEPAALRRRVAEVLTPTLEEIVAGPAAAAVDPALARAAERTRGTVARAVGRFIDRYERTLLARDAVTGQRFERLQAALCPHGVPQERFYAWPSLAARHGWRPYKRLVLDNLETVGPFATALRDIQP